MSELQLPPSFVTRFRQIYLFALLVVPVFVAVNLYLGRYPDAALLVGMFVLLLAVYVLRDFLLSRGVDVVLNLFLIVCVPAQVYVLDINRHEPNVGFIWFYGMATVSTLMSNRWNAVIWHALCLLALLFTWWRAPEEVLIWQHPLTLPNLVAASLFLAVISFSLQRSRQQRQAELQSALGRANELSERSRRSEERAIAASAEKSRLLATMSHELLSPMMAVSASTELLLFSETDVEKRRILTALRHSAAVLTRIINDILDLSRLNANHQVIETRRFSLRTLIEDLSILFAQVFDNNGLYFVVDIDPEVPKYWIADDVRLRQVVINLLSNVAKYTFEGGVLFRARAIGGELELTVRDTGIGIAQGDLDEVFKPYHQLGNDKVDRPLGVGLGLAIVNELVSAMGARLAVESTPGQGSTFVLTCAQPDPVNEEFGASTRREELVGRSIELVSSNEWAARSVERWLRYWGVETDLGASTRFDLDAPDTDAAVLRNPRALQEALTGRFSDLAPRVAPAVPTPVPASLTMSHRGVCGIVDDDSELRLVMTKGLEFLGYSVLALRTGEEALKAALDGRVDVMLMDLHMPGTDGLDVVGAIRSSTEPLADLPVCIISGNAAHEAKCLEAGANRFMTKPARISEIASTVDALFSQSEGLGLVSQPHPG